MLLPLIRNAQTIVPLNLIQSIDKKLVDRNARSAFNQLIQKINYDSTNGEQYKFLLKEALDKFNIEIYTELQKNPELNLQYLKLERIILNEILYTDLTKRTNSHDLKRNANWFVSNYKAELLDEKKLIRQIKILFNFNEPVSLYLLESKVEVASKIVSKLISLNTSSDKHLLFRFQKDLIKTQEYINDLSTDCDMSKIVSLISEVLNNKKEVSSKVSYHLRELKTILESINDKDNNHNVYDMINTCSNIVKKLSIVFFSDFELNESYKKLLLKISQIFSSFSNKFEYSTAIKLNILRLKDKLNKLNPKSDTKISGINQLADQLLTSCDSGFDVKLHDLICILIDFDSKKKVDNITKNLIHLYTKISSFFPKHEAVVSLCEIVEDKRDENLNFLDRNNAIRDFIDAIKVNKFKYCSLVRNGTEISPIFKAEKYLKYCVFRIDIGDADPSAVALKLLPLKKLDLAKIYLENDDKTINLAIPLICIEPDIEKIILSKPIKINPNLFYRTGKYKGGDIIIVSEDQDWNLNKGFVYSGRSETILSFTRKPLHRDAVSNIIFYLDEKKYNIPSLFLELAYADISNPRLTKERDFYKVEVRCQKHRINYFTELFKSLELKFYFSQN